MIKSVLCRAHTHTRALCHLFVQFSRRLPHWLIIICSNIFSISNSIAIESYSVLHREMFPLHFVLLFIQPTIFRDKQMKFISSYRITNVLEWGRWIREKREKRKHEFIVCTMYSHKQIKWSNVAHFIHAVEQLNKPKQRKKRSRDWSLRCSSLHGSLESLVARTHSYTM